MSQMPKGLCFMFTNIFETITGGGCTVQGFNYNNNQTVQQTSLYGTSTKRHHATHHVGSAYVASGIHESYNQVWKHWHFTHQGE